MSDGFFCTRCGSPNHTAFDCAKPDQHLTCPVASPTGGNEMREGVEEKHVSTIQDPALQILAAGRVVEPPKWKKLAKRKRNKDNAQVSAQLDFVT